MNQVLVQYDGDMAITVTFSPSTPGATSQQEFEGIRPTRLEFQPKPRPRPAGPARAVGDLSYTQFWTEARELFPDLKAPAIRQALEVETMKSWVAQGRTLHSALEVLLALRNGRTLEEVLVSLSP